MSHVLVGLAKPQCFRLHYLRHTIATNNMGVNVEVFADCHTPDGVGFEKDEFTYVDKNNDKYSRCRFF